MDGAVRVFAGEFNASTLPVRNNADDAPWVVTPGGAWCRTIYLAGALTEVVEDGDMMRCRIADPTGAFDIVIGGRKNSVAETLRGMPVPSFVTVNGQARLFQKTGRSHLSIRPDGILSVDRAIRDQWVLVTAEATLVRLENLRLALDGKIHDEQVLIPLRHYGTTRAKIEELCGMVEHAIGSLHPPAQSILERARAPDDNARERVMDIMKTGSGPRGIAVEEIIARAAERGISPATVLAAIEALIVDDECYQSQKGFVKPL
ncbi:MAG: hypothetical protein METHP_01975 [Methanoregula sp. SKADARSKE-2]|nr:MAG: hypothetical protein METHP_01975 [Methanoregula sp. SKADARSKE-2]